MWSGLMACGCTFCRYVATSALCVTGLISVTMNQLSTFDKVFLMFLMLVGSQVFTSLVPVIVRRYGLYRKKQSHCSRRPAMTTVVVKCHFKNDTVSTDSFQPLMMPPCFSLQVLLQEVPQERRNP